MEGLIIIAALFGGCWGYLLGVWRSNWRHMKEVGRILEIADDLAGRRLYKSAREIREDGES